MIGFIVRVAIRRTTTPAAPDIAQFGSALYNHPKFRWFIERSHEREPPETETRASGQHSAGAYALLSVELRSGLLALRPRHWGLAHSLGRVLIRSGRCGLWPPLGHAHRVLVRKLRHAAAREGLHRLPRRGRLLPLVVIAITLMRRRFTGSHRSDRPHLRRCRSGPHAANVWRSPLNRDNRLAACVRRGRHSLVGRTPDRPHSARSGPGIP
jgi:hypothetical protein